MGTYGLRDDETDEEVSIEAAVSQPLQRQPVQPGTLQINRKRTFPAAFPVEEPPEVYPYNTAVQQTRGDWGVRSQLVMDCFKTVFSWVAATTVLVGSILFENVGSLLIRSKQTNVIAEDRANKRQRVASSHVQSENWIPGQGSLNETTPLLLRQPEPVEPPNTQPRIARNAPRVLVQEESPDGFLAGKPYIEPPRRPLPRPRRNPPPSRATRLQKLAAELQSSTQNVPRVTSGPIRKPLTARATPYDRKVSADAMSRLEKLEERAKKNLSPTFSTEEPTFDWADEEVKKELRGYHKRKPSQRQSVSFVPPQKPLPSQSQRQSFKFEFETAGGLTPFKFGQQFTSPPKSGAPKNVREENGSLAVDKSLFTFTLPPSTEKERTHGGRLSRPPETERSQDPTATKTIQKNGVHSHSQSLGGMATSFAPKGPWIGQSTSTSSQSNQQIVDSKSTFTLISNQEPRQGFIRKSVPVSKSQSYTYHLNQKADPPSLNQPMLSQSFPPSNLPTSGFSRPPTAEDTKPDDTQTTPHHRRTKSDKSLPTPTRSSHRSKFTSTYAEDSHRAFIRDLRSILGQKKARSDAEEREIEDQIRKLREEGKAVESSLAGEIAKLPDWLSRRVHEALFDTPDDVVVVENEFGKVTGRDIHRLQKGEWLNDELINYYLNLIKARSANPAKVVSSKFGKNVSSLASSKKKLPRAFAFNTFFYSLLAQRGYSGVRRWTKKAKVNLFEMDRVLIPINKGGFHWILCVVNVEYKRIEYYDSMGREGESAENRSVLTNVRNFMVEEAKNLGQNPQEVENWTFYVPKTPKQKNGWDCGVFTCITAERLTGEVGRMNYGQDHMDRLREYMVAEIIDGVFYH